MAPATTGAPATRTTHARPELFANFTQLPTRVPTAVWNTLRALTLAAMLGLVALLFAAPKTGLLVLWGLVVPLLPAVWLVAPGLWRNICPLSASNQIPRMFGFSRGLTLPNWARQAAYVIGIVLFLTIASLRQVVFNQDGRAAGALLLGLMGAAFLGGLVFKGKSGWCSTFCPLLPIQRIYGQTPAIVVPNSYCKPCVGCAKNCYDFNPTAAQLADVHDDDPRYSGYRKFFAALFPGFIFGFFHVAPEAAPLERLGTILVSAGLSLAVFATLQTFARFTAFKLMAEFGALAWSLFYWFGLPVVARAFGELTGAEVPEAVIWALRAVVVAVSLLWIFMTFEREHRFLTRMAASNVVRVRARDVLQRHVQGNAKAAEVTFQPAGRRVEAKPNQALLEVAEAHGQAIEAGCRMGVCGADPVAVVAGGENLSPIGDDERATLDRLGHAPNTRMACMARVCGPVSIALTPDKVDPARRTADARAQSARAGSYDPNIKRIVIIGNGIAGVTAADYARRHHPDCEIHLLAREPHHLYNRMALARVIYGRSALHGLYLLPESWYEERRVTTWLNTRATAIDRAKKAVTLATGEALTYDRLVLATGARSFVPTLPGLDGAAGAFVVREASDAIAVRSFVQEQRCQRAIVLGAGLLGLEAAYAVHKLGLPVTVLDRGAMLMPRQLDARASEVLTRYLAGLGIEVVTDAETTRVAHDDEGRVGGVELADGRLVRGDLLLVCVGIRANSELATDAGLAVGRHGVTVDAHLRTSDPDIFAAGDVAELAGQIGGLWPVGVEQAKVCARNATAPAGQDAAFELLAPVTMLKVSGVDLLSVGQTQPEGPDDEALVPDEPDARRYRKLVLRRGAVVGAIVLGYPELFPSVTTAVKAAQPVASFKTALRSGDWGLLGAG